MVNLVMIKCSKPVQMEYKTRHDWMGKGIHWELIVQEIKILLSS